MGELVRVRSHEYTIDRATGYLQDTASNGVTVEQKKMLIEMLEENPHGVGVKEACAKVGISESSFYRHVVADPAFRAAWEKLKEIYGYRVEAVNANLALEPKYVIDRMAYLRAFRRERYAPEMRQSVPQASDTPSEWEMESAKIIDVEQIHSKSDASPSSGDSSCELSKEKGGGGGGGEAGHVQKK